MSIKLKGSTGGSVSWDAPADTSPSGTDVTLTLPTSAGSAGQYLRNSSTAGSLEFGDLPSSGLVLTRAASITTTSGTSIDFTNIPANVYRITVMFDGVSLSGTDYISIRIGDSGGLETSGYESGAALGASSGLFSDSQGGFLQTFANARGAANKYYGSTIITNLTGNTWVSQGTNYVTGYGAGGHNAGTKTLSGTLDRLSVIPSGNNTFDAGKINIIYEVQS
jgi:hypothetical protein